MWWFRTVKIIAGNIINFSREPARRNEFIIGRVPTDADIDKVKQLLTRIIESEDRILKDREMTVRLHELGASSVNYVVRVWSLSSDLQSVYWDVLERIKREFDANGISFPYPADGCSYGSSAGESGVIQPLIQRPAMLPLLLLLY
ncbi:Small-conductance mechanosensitive channel [Raoultella planticola]|uniref:Small-conductance mechanosensitive channel n=1 Tax=Raoultella planticola TaxID=575 RepID=A0A485C1K9_RAOPL|nr:Small-conductance mechanosensitive channel [Raoultella planticola]